MQVTMLSVTINGRTYGPREVRDELSMNDFLREYLDRRYGGPVGGNIHGTGQGADASALSELPSCRRPPAPRRGTGAA
jgi:hypothetical protein